MPVTFEQPEFLGGQQMFNVSDAVAGACLTACTFTTTCASPSRSYSANLVVDR